MLEKLKEEVYKANIELPAKGLVLFTWGNVSAIDREKNLVVIKPSGVEYDKLKPEDMVVVNLDGKVVEGNLNPSSDTPTHIELYKKSAYILFSNILRLFSLKISFALLILLIIGILLRLFNSDKSSDDSFLNPRSRG